MPLHLIHGPLNSGRTGLVLDRVREAARRAPLLVSPNRDARRSLELELAESGAVLGIQVVAPLELARSILQATGEAVPLIASPAQSMRLTRLAIDRSRLDRLGEAAGTPGFAAALERQIADLRSALIEPDADPGPDRALAEVLDLYRRRMELLEAAGLADISAVMRAARQALKARGEAWRSRPVFALGFDDLARDQLELFRALSEVCEVTLSATHEDRLSLAARSRLFNDLNEIAATVEMTEPRSDYTDSPLLFHLERHFGEDRPATAAASPALTLLRSAGTRGEAEMIAERVKGLILDGVRPAEIAIAVRDVGASGARLHRRLTEAGVPAALETSRPLQQTATGTACLALLRAFHGSRTAADVLAYLRAAPGLEPPAVHRTEKLIMRGRLRTADQAIAAFERAGGDDSTLEELERAAADTEAVAEALKAAVERFAAAATALEPEGAYEAAAARAIAGALDELAELPAGLPAPGEIATALQEIEIPAHRGAVGDRVRIASPYALFPTRSARVRHLFVASLQNREFPKTGRDGGPILTRSQLEALAFPGRAEPEAEELYLFQVCLGLPTEGLWLSTRSADDEGKALEPSPYIEMVGGMIDGGVEAIATVEHGLDRVTTESRHVCNRRELARTVARTAGGNGEPEAPASNGPAEPLAEALHALTAARARGRDAARCRPLGDPAIIDLLAARAEFSPTEIERFGSDPGQWFVDRLAPLPLGPDPEVLQDGSLAHAVLEQLYHDPPQGSPLPETQTLGRWRERASELVDELASRHGRDRRDPVDRAAMRQIRLHLGQFLERDCALAGSGYRPSLFEASFGSRDSCDRGPLQLDGWSLTGTIDRIDRASDGTAIVHDYKFSANATAVAKLLEERKLQLPLYAIAARELWGLEPVAALYRPLKLADQRPRGPILADDSTTEELAGLEPFRYDLLPADAFESLLREATELADETVAAIRRGEVDREPRQGAKAPDAATMVITRRFRDRLVDVNGDGPAGAEGFEED